MPRGWAVVRASKQPWWIGFAVSASEFDVLGGRDRMGGQEPNERHLDVRSPCLSRAEL
jgi:hypothetical protein